MLTSWLETLFWYQTTCCHNRCVLT